MRIIDNLNSILVFVLNRKDYLICLNIILIHKMSISDKIKLGIFIPFEIRSVIYHRASFEHHLLIFYNRQIYNNNLKRFILHYILLEYYHLQLRNYFTYLN